MPSFTEPAHTGEFLIAPSDDMGTRSFDVITVDQNQTLVPGQVLGQVIRGALSVVAAKAGTGNGAIAGAAVAAGSKLGAYVASCVGAAANGGKFIFEDPDGVELGEINVGVQFNLGGITATIADGATDWAEGDQVTYTVSAATPSDQNDWVALNLTATDGSQNVAGIAYEAVTTGAGQTKKSVAVTRSAEVNGNLITYPAGANGAQIAAINAALNTLGIVVR